MSRDGPVFRLIGLLDSARKVGSGWEASCPGPRHGRGDKRPSLSISTGLDGRALVNCHGGCTAEEIVSALGLTMADLFEDQGRTRRYRVQDGIYHIRREGPNGKSLSWEANGKPTLNGTSVLALPLYGLPVLPERPGAPVIVCEGEKAAQALLDAGYAAVGTVTGADKTPSDDTLAPLHGREVWLWPDNDDIGREHMRRIAAKLSPAPKWIIWPDAPPKGDAADWLAGDRPIGDELAAWLHDSLPGAESQRTSSGLDIVRMSDVQPEPIEWHWDGRLARGKPTLLMGDPGLGKSLITHDMAARTSKGGTWPDGLPCPQGPAILFTTEDGLADTVAPRLLAAGAVMEHIYAVRGVIGDDAKGAPHMFALTEHIALLEQLIKETGAIFVCMDPISSYLGPDVNSHKEADVRAVLGPLSLMAERTRIVLLMLMHLNKGSGVSALYRSTGSIAFPAVARVVLGVAPDPNDEDGKRRLLLPVKMNIGKTQEGIGYRIETAEQRVLRRANAAAQPPILAWDNEPVAIDATSALDRNGTPQEMGALAESKQAILQILGSGPVPANECKRQLRESVGVTSETTLSRARKELGVRVRREGFGGGGVWYWSLHTSPFPPDSPKGQSMRSMEGMERPSAPLAALTIKESMEIARAREDSDDEEVMWR